MKRIAPLAVFFVALTEFGLERARLDLWIMVGMAAVLLWNIVGPALRSHEDSQSYDHSDSIRK